MTISVVSSGAETYTSAGNLVADMIEHAPEDMLSLFFGPLSTLPSGAKQVTASLYTSQDFLTHAVMVEMLSCIDFHLHACRR